MSGYEAADICNLIYKIIFFPVWGYEKAVELKNKIKDKKGKKNDHN